MKYLTAKRLNIKKAARFAIVINVLQVIAIIAVIAYVLLSSRGRGRFVEFGVLTLALLIIGWGAVLDIREAINAERVAEQASMLEDAYNQLEALNGTLRKQRHDFMNHLQVVFSLMEMREYPDAMQYVESIYGDIRKTGSALKTAIPAVNALIAAKRADCEERGIALSVDIRSGWRELPVPGWEMCRVLGNLIDNAREALLADEATMDRRIDLTIDETPGAYTFRVANNGPAIPPQLHRSIFQLGFTTKSDGHGSGLSIVEEIVKDYGGEIRVESNEENTAFIGSIPKKGAE